METVTIDGRRSEFLDFFIDELKDIYWSEQHLVESLPKLKEAATNAQVADAFEKHTRETQQHVAIVEQVFRLLDLEPEAKKCDAMKGILKEADVIISDTEKDTFTRDAALILAGQKAEHYEIATYGTLRIFAGHLGLTEIAKLLSQILENEKHTDVSLTKLAESFVNERAAAE